MDDDVVVWLILLLVVGVGGWFLGVRGYFKSRRALREIADLRRQIATAASVREAATEPTPASVPTFTPEPIPEPASEPELLPADSEPEREPEPVAAMPEPAKRPDFETLLTTRWGVWLGSGALLLAGVFLIRYAVDEGLLGPATRCVLAVLLGVALLVGAEWLRRREASQQVLMDRAAPALAAGGVAILFGAAYGAGVLYDLVPPLIGFALMAAASLIGLAVSLRHGQLIGAVGIAGAFVSPALVQTEDPSLPGLFLYLLFVTAAALAVVRYTAWIWLGWATTIAGAIWVLLGLATGAHGEIWAAALFVPAAAALNLALLPPAALEHPVGRYLSWVPCAALGAVGLIVQLAVTEWSTRAGILLLAPIMIAKAAREPRLAWLPYLSALLILLMLASWSLDLWTRPDFVLPPEAWVPPDVSTFLWTSGLVAAGFAIAGLWFERRSVRAVSWAGLVASVPVLTLAVAYARVEQFNPRASWAAVALALAAGLSAAAAAALREHGDAVRQRAGAHAAGAVAALALGCAMLLADQWLSVAIALFLPALAWVEARADLPPLRQVALAAAAFVLVRLLLNHYVVGYAFGEIPVLNGLLAAYGIPAASFALAARMFRQRGDDLTVAVLEAGSIAFATVLVVLEIRHFATYGEPFTPDTSFLEAALQIASLAILASATMRIATRLQRPVLQWGWRIQGTLALAGGIVLLVANPAVTGDPTGHWPLLDWLLPAYLVPGALAIAAIRHPATAEPKALRPVLACYALFAGFVWVTLEVRHLFHLDAMGFDTVPVQDAELWAWSGAWLAYGAVVMAVGIGMREQKLRLAALAVIGLVVAKVFLVDMGDLVGLWRVLSFLGLGLSLIALGAVYRRFVAKA
jgi:uncharacterized membrane protein